MASTKTEDIQADIVIIGGGISGLSAAVSAAEAGAKNVTVLEKAKATGGNGRVSVGFFAAGSPAQKQAGLKVSPDETFKRFMEFNHWKTDARLVRVWVNKTAEIASWLEGKGIKTILAGTPFYFEGQGFAKWHMCWQGEGKPPEPVGRPIVEALTKECQKQGVRLLLGTSARQILTDKKQGVTGVLAAGKDGEVKITAKSVIIGTGGFAGSKKMMKKYFPLYSENIYTTCLPQMTGDGLIMAEGAGASIDESSIAFVFFGANYYRWNNYLTYLHKVGEMIHVNKKGERYTLEYNGVSFDNANALNRQPEGISYSIFDTKIKQDIVNKRRPAGPGMEALAARDDWLDVIENSIQKEVANGRIKLADSWDEIAEFIGAKPEVLRATIERYNSFCDQGYDADFLKEKQYLWPLRTPPYYAVISVQGLDVSVGGIKINHRMEVLDKQGDPIGGLYAAGNDAGGVHGGVYTGGAGTPGCDFSFALCSGYIAGESAAEYILVSRKAGSR